MRSSTAAASGDGELPAAEEGQGDAETAGGSPAAPDGGWGWAVVAGSVLVNFLLIGQSKAFGVYFSPLMETFGATTSRVAWIQSLQMSVFTLTAPVSSIMSDSLGPRAMGMLGGLAACLGLALSSAAPSLEALYFTYGVMQGLAMALTFTPGVMMLGRYFSKRRGLANGINMAGNALGGIVMPLVVNLLLETYGLSGGLLVMAGLLLNACVGVALWWPLRQPPKPPIHPVKVSTPDPDKTILGPGVLLLKYTDHRRGTVFTREAYKNCKCPVNGEDSPLYISDIQVSSRLHSPTIPACIHPLVLHEYQKSNGTAHSPQYDSIVSDHRLGYEKKSPDYEHAIADCGFEYDNGIITDRCIEYDVVDDNMYDLAKFPERRKEYFNYDDLLKTPPERRRDVEDCNVRSKERRRVARNNSVASSLLYVSSLQLGPSTTAMTPEEVRQPVPDKKTRSSEKLVDTSVLRNGTFYIMTCCLFFHQLGYSGTQTYLPLRGLSLGLTQRQAATLLSALAFADFIGRVLCGWLSDMNICPRKYWFMGGMFLSAVFTFCIQFMQDYFSLLLCSCAFGLSAGSYIGLIIALFSDLFGAHRVGFSYSTSVLFSGGMSLAGPPFLGFVLEKTKSYSILHCILGCAQLAGCSVWLFEPLARSRNESVAKKNTPQSV